MHRCALLAAAVTAVALLVGPAGARASLFGPAHQAVPFASGVTSLAVTDFNRDGDPDLLVTGPGAAGAAFGGPAAGFRAPLGNLDSGADQLAGAAVGDLDGDGDPDVLIADQSMNSLIVRFLGADGQTFGAAGSLSAGFGPSSVALADLDGDGVTDIAVVTQLLDFGLGAWVTQSPIPVGLQPRDIVTADFNGDGHPDLATANEGSDTVSVLLEQAGGTFALSNHNAGGSPRALVAADFNRDGRPDLAVADNASESVSVLLGVKGGFAPAAAFPAGAGPVAIAAADFDGDGRTDLAVADAGGAGVSILRGDGAGGFGAPAAFPAGGAPAALAVADFDGDGRPDLAVGEPGGVFVLVNTGLPAAAVQPGSVAFGAQTAGTVGPERTVTVTNSGDRALRSLSVAKLGAGAGDFAVADGCAGAVVPAGGTCTIGLRFVPSAPGASSATLQVAGNGMAPLAVALSGTGTAPLAAPAGVAGPPGPRGPAGQPGTDRTVLVAVLSAGRVSGRHVAVGYVSTAPARVTLELRRGSRVVQRVRQTVGAGRHSVRLRAPSRPGTYALRLTAVAGAQRVTDKARLLVR
jgi:hypothetical protein